MNIQIAEVALLLVTLMIAFSGIGIVSPGQTTETGTHQFEAGTPDETYEPNTTLFVKQERESIRTGQTNNEADNCSTTLKTMDSDADRVNDFVECSQGLNENTADTDGDTLTDAEELRNRTHHGTPIPNSDPREKDIYVVIGMSDGAKLDTEQLASIFDNFEAENHNGTTGINLHYDIQQVNETVRIGDFLETQQAYKSKLTRGSEVYRGLFITTSGTAEYVGKANIRTNFAIALTGREKTAAHELLHLVVGRIYETDCEDEFHNCHSETLLSPADDDNEQLSHNTTIHIQERGLGPHRHN